MPKSFSALLSRLRREILLLPPILTLGGMALYLIRYAWLMGDWVLPSRQSPCLPELGGNEDFVIAAMVCSVMAGPFWLGQQGYRWSAGSWHRRTFWIGLMLYLAVGYLLIGDFEGIIPERWD
jgi:hypothetical protein